MRTRSVFVAAIIAFASPCAAQTSDYDSASGVLTLPRVVAGSESYTNLRLRLGADGLWSILASDPPTTSGSPAPAVPNYDRATSVLTVPSVAVGTIAYGNARVRLGADGRWSLLGADGPLAGSVYNPSALVSGKILFAAHRSTDPQAPMKIWTVNPDGTGLTEFTSDSNYQAPDVESNGSGGWKVAWDWQSNLSVFDSDTRQTTVITAAGATRADLSRDAARVTYQAFPPEYQPGPGVQFPAGIAIYVAALSGNTTPLRLTSLAPPNNAEWPYFLPSGNRIMYFVTSPRPGKNLINTDGSAEAAVPAPGGLTVSHSGLNADGTELLDAQGLTSHSLATGAVGTLNDLKRTTTLLNQLASLGYREVPVSQVPGQGMRGTFALSADWSRDGRRIVFDALVADAGGTIKGVAIFVWDITAAALTLLNPPEPLVSGRNNNYNYSLATPRWIP